jgi:hypothetical protein
LEGPHCTGPNCDKCDISLNKKPCLPLFAHWGNDTFIQSTTSQAQDAPPLALPPGVRSVASLCACALIISCMKQGSMPLQPRPPSEKSLPGVAYGPLEHHWPRVGTGHAPVSSGNSVKWTPRHCGFATGTSKLV